MQKQAPSFGRILTMVLFALSCFGLLLFRLRLGVLSVALLIGYKFERMREWFERMAGKLTKE